MMTAEQLKPGVIVRFEDGSTYDVLSIKDNKELRRALLAVREACAEDVEEFRVERGELYLARWARKAVAR